MVGESNQNVFLIQIDASNLTEFEISEFEISRFDCILVESVLIENINRILSLKKQFKNI